ncbi:unnamed protein product [Paramecium sonneborni]|uniref:Uncharacterized protein n=1 Tax=Paramecium sonneborni TaxID=65129 RepID=A0A8S1LHF6_9CILI|nr:unnamed protein product [Paramecium sonneborni]
MMFGVEFRMSCQRQMLKHIPLEFQTRMIQQCFMSTQSNKYKISDIICIRYHNKIGPATTLIKLPQIYSKG